MGTIFGAICGLTALTAISAEVFYDFSINTKSPIHMSKLNNLVQKATNTNGSEEDASAKYSGLTGTPEMKKWYGENGEDVYIMSDSLRLHGKLFKNPGTNMPLSVTDIQARQSIWQALSTNFTRSAIMFCTFRGFLFSTQVLQFQRFVTATISSRQVQFNRSKRATFQPCSSMVQRMNLCHTEC